ncbi:MAG TPA: nucleotidyltransferase domain-containing protein [Verrucomicrobiae bacterium]|nr:nucleotidyltransferase domain-containing protein [Verrucomicrobiae bacterium]
MTLSAWRGQQPVINLLRQLRELDAKITGSYARGEESWHSDLDVYVPETQWAKAERLMLNSGLGFRSTLYLLQHDTPIRLEVSPLFYRQTKPLKGSVEIFGVNFQTH